MNYQRDAFIKKLTEKANNDRNIVVLSADFGAPMLDEYINRHPDQFFHLGISEQNMIDVAIGMASQGKKVFAYAMAPFVVLRCAEQHKLAAIMNSPITTIVAGVGLGYANAGPTHYATEDLGVCMGLTGSHIFSISDPNMASNAAEYLIQNPKFSFVRLDRDPSENIDGAANIDFDRGFRELSEGQAIAVVSHGYMLQRTYRLLEENPILKNKVTLIDLFRSKPVSPDFLEVVKSFDKILIIDEQIQSSSLGTFLLPQILSENSNVNVRSLHLAEEFMFGNTGRNNLLSEAGLGDRRILNEISDLLGQR